MEELKALPSNYPHREIVLELVYGLLEKLEAKKQDKQETIEEDETLIMSLRQLYRDKMAEVEQKGLQQGIQQGIQQERLQLIIHQLKRKLGQLSPELESQVKSLSFLTLESLAEALLDFNSTNDLIDWLDNYSH
jgi:flagellar biosynthesis/type III secretory pathway protein FliH